MPFELRDRVATLSGVQAPEEVEPLAAWPRTTARPSDDLMAGTTGDTESAETGPLIELF